MSTLSLSGWSGSDGRKIELTTESVDIDTANNRSKVKWTITVTGGSSTYYSTFVRVTINGSVVYDETEDTIFPARRGSESGKTEYIVHKTDGTQSVTVKLEAWVYTHTTKTTSTTMTLTPIARASVPTVNTTSSGSTIVSTSPVLTKVYIQTHTASSTFRHKLTYDIGSLTNQTSGIDSGDLSGFINWAGFTPPIELLKQLDISDGDKKTLTINLTTYTDNTYSTIIDTKTTTFILTGTGYVSIDNGSSFNNYIAFVDNGSSWDRVVPYIDNGSSWDLY